MARVYSLSKSGGFVKIVVTENGVTQNYYRTKNAINLTYEPIGNSVNVQMGDQNADGAVAIANLTMGGVVITSQAVFDAQVALLLSEAGTLTNNDATISTLTAATVGASSADQTNTNWRGVQIGINVTAMTGTIPTLNVNIEGKDVASGQYYLLLASAAISAAGFTNLVVYPGVTNATNSASSKPLPKIWRVSYVVGGTTPAVTASIGASVII